jgi:hypothetical protein
VGLRDLISTLKEGKIPLPSVARVPDDHVLVDGYQATPFEVGRHYFTVRANSIGLRNNRQWFTTWQPMLVAMTEFRYGTEEVSVPFVIGPATLSQRANAEIPLATVYAATKLAGTHPYIGDRVAVTVLLFRVKDGDYVQQILGVVDKMAAAFDYSMLLTPYLRLTEAVIDGIDSILGIKDTATVLGHRIEYNPNTGDIFRPGYYALTASAMDSAALWVRDDHLLRVGPDAASAQPVIDDFVLYSITGTDKRNDIESMPWFAPLWERVDRGASTPSEDGKRAMKTHLGILYEQLRRSPDVAREQVDELYDKQESDALRLHARALRLASLGQPPVGPAAGEDDLQREFLAILDKEW